MRLADALAAMPPAAFERLLARRGVEIDAAKRLTPIEQAARALAPLPHRRIAALPPSAHDALRALTPRPGRAPRAALGGGVLPLVELGLAFPVDGEPDVIAMPGAYRLQLPPPAAEDPRAARALLAAIDDETYKAIAIQHLGRPPVAPRWLVLGDVLAALESTSDVERTLASLARTEQRVLAAIEARGAEASAEELLELAKEPARWGPAHALPRHGLGHALLARGLVLPHGAGAYALPAEVAAVVGRERRAVALRVREDVARRIALSDDDPARAHLAEDPGPVAVALLAELAARRELEGGTTAVRRSALARGARAIGVEPERAELLVALARAARIGSSPLSDVRARLVATWRAGGAWDEARLEPDRLRVSGPVGAIPTPTAALREALLELLASLPEGRFASEGAVLRATRADLRCDAAATQLRRAEKKAAGAFLPDADAILGALLDRSLPALGLVDRARDAVSSGDASGARLRLSPSGRALVRGVPPRGRAAEGAARWEGGGRLRAGPAVEVGRILAIAPIVSAIPRDDHVVLALDPARIAEVAARGELEAARSALGALAPVDGDAARLLAVEPRPVVACELVPASAFVAIPDEALCAAITDDPALAPMVARRLAGGVLLAEGASVRRFERRLRELGGAIRPAHKAGPEGGGSQR